MPTPLHAGLGDRARACFRRVKLNGVAPLARPWETMRVGVRRYAGNPEFYVPGLPSLMGSYAEVTFRPAKGFETSYEGPIVKSFLENFQILDQKSRRLYWISDQRARVRRLRGLNVPLTFSTIIMARLPH